MTSASGRVMADRASCAATSARSRPTMASAKAALKAMPARARTLSRMPSTWGTPARLMAPASPMASVVESPMPDSQAAWITARVPLPLNTAASFSSPTRSLPPCSSSNWMIACGGCVRPGSFLNLPWAKRKTTWGSTSRTRRSKVLKRPSSGISSVTHPATTASPSACSACACCSSTSSRPCSGSTSSGRQVNITTRKGPRSGGWAAAGPGKRRDSAKRLSSPRKPNAG